VAAVVVLLGAACRPLPSTATAPARPIVRIGPERIALAYADPLAGDKRALLDRINRDRAEAGVPPVRDEPRAALVGDRFCFDAALTRSSGHWDVSGRAPYLRWALAGGVDYESENVASYSISGGPFERPARELLFEAQAAMMAEQAPRDGHRRTILDPLFTHVGIGMAMVGGEFRMSEEFTRVAFEWVELPDGPLRAGARARFAGLPLPEWEVGLVEIRFEPPPHAVDAAELRTRGSYHLPPLVQTLRPRLPEGSFYDTGDRGEFTVENGRIELSFLVDRRGHYFVVCYLRKKGAGTEVMTPGTAALVTAEG
jgi:uncharacterized protein YkwD